MNKTKILRRALSLALHTTLLCFLASNAMGEQVSNLTSSEFEKRINDLAKEGFRPVKIWSKQLGTFDSASVKPGYWATLKKDPNGPPWQAIHGFNAEHYQQEFNKWTSAGYVPTDVNVACVGSKVLYCGVFEKIPNAPATVARHNIDNATFQKQNAICSAQGYKLKVKSSCHGPAGWVHAAIWQK